MSRTIPTINTAQATLRAFAPQDFDAFAALWAMPDIVRFIGGMPRSRSEAWNAFLCNAGHWQMAGFGQWAIEEHKTKRMIGQVGFIHHMRGLGPDFDHAPEAGWVLDPMFHGQGIARDAARAAHDWFDRVVTGPLVCQVHPDNAPSLQVAEALGYLPLRMAAFRDAPSQLMSRARPPQTR